MSAVLSSKLGKLLEEVVSPIEGQVYLIDLGASRIGQYHFRFDSKKDLLELSQFMSREMLNRVLVPYQINVNYYPKIGEINDEFFSGNPRVKVVYGKIRFYQELLKLEGPTDWYSSPDRKKFTVRGSDRVRLFEETLASDYNIAVDTGETILILKNPAKEEFLNVPYQGPIRLWVTSQGMAFTRLMNGQGRTIKKLVRDCIYGLPELPESVYTEEKDPQGAEVIGISAKRSSADDLLEVFEQSQIVQDMSGSETVSVVGMKTKRSIWVNREEDISQAIWEMAKTDDKIYLSSDGLDTDFYIYLT